MFASHFSWGSGVVPDQARIYEDFEKLGFFCRPGQKEASLEEFDAEMDGWLPSLSEIFLPPLTVRFLLKSSVAKVPLLVV